MNNFIIKINDKRVKELCLNKGITIEELAKQIGMQRSSLSRLIHRNEINSKSIFENAEKISKVLDTPVKNILNVNSDLTDGMGNLIKQVEQWSKDRDLDRGNPDRQFIKQVEEQGEIAAALSRGNLEALKDGIGDTVVTLIILAQQHGMTLEECLQFAYNEIADRKGVTRNGTFIKEEDL